jgi:ketosteroid isomerase-like protein
MEIMNRTEEITKTIIALENAALQRWGAGDPSGYLEISAQDVVYFDPFLEKRIDGLEALASWYAPIRGTIHIDHYDLINPNVQVCGEAAVLTFNLISHSGKTPMYWNCTEVYRFDKEGWRIIQTHWSITQHLKNQ